MIPGVAILGCAIGLAALNGANDVSKAVATLAGSGVTRYRAAVLWGTAATAAGALASLAVASPLVRLFSTGVVTAPPTEAFAVAVAAGAISWVLYATVRGLPVSTTHAIVGALIGAGLHFGPGAIEWDSLPARIVAPLLGSVFLSYGISVGLNRLAAGPSDPRAAREAAPASGAPRTGPGSALTGAHWVSSAATAFARGLNDTPKIVAVSAFAVTAGLVDTQLLVALVAAAMAGGSLVAGIRVTRRLAENVVKMSHVEGFLANLTTALLVGAGANVGLPMSTTHVSTAAIAGIARTDLSRVDQRTLRDFVLAWTATPIAAGVAACVVLAAARWLLPGTG